MKVLLLNGSPHKNGCTYTAINEIANVLNSQDIETLIFQIETEPVASCRACGACEKLKKCVVNDKVNEFIDLADNSDGFVFASPVHYASACGAITAFLDRAFFASARSGRKVFDYKPMTCVASARRAGTTATLDQLYKYATITQMPIISGRYWNMVHGNSADEVKKDKEGMQNMRIVANNMAWILKSIETAKSQGINHPIINEQIEFTNFIR